VQQRSAPFSVAKSDLNDIPDSPAELKPARWRPEGTRRGALARHNPVATEPSATAWRKFRMLVVQAEKVSTMRDINWVDRCDSIEFVYVLIERLAFGQALQLIERPARIGLSTDSSGHLLP
jgi:hypothetical protein